MGDEDRKGFRETIEEWIAREDDAIDELETALDNRIRERNEAADVIGAPARGDEPGEDEPDEPDDDDERRDDRSSWSTGEPDDDAGDEDAGGAGKAKS